MNVEIEYDNLGSEILQFENALSELRNGKAAGVDNKAGELLSALRNSGKDELFYNCEDIYAKWPNEFADTIIIPRDG